MWDTRDRFNIKQNCLPTTFTLCNVYPFHHIGIYSLDPFTPPPPLLSLFSLFFSFPLLILFYFFFFVFFIHSPKKKFIVWPPPPPPPPLFFKFWLLEPLPLGISMDLNSLGWVWKLPGLCKLQDLVCLYMYLEPYLFVYCLNELLQQKKTIFLEENV